MVKRNFPFLRIAAAVILISGAGVFILLGRTVPLKAGASVNHTDVLIGDSIRYSLLVDSRKDVAIDMPDLSSHFAAFSVRNSKRTVEDTFGRRIYRYIYLIAKEEPGDYQIGPIRIRYKIKGDAEWSEKSVRGFDIRVRGVLGKEDVNEDHKEKIRIGGDIIGRRGASKEGEGSDRTMTVDSAFNYRIKDTAAPKSVLTLQDIIFFSLSGLAGLVLFIAILTFLYDRTFRKKIPPVPIDVAALERLKGLDPQHAGINVQPKDFCFLLSSTLKDYLRSRFNMESREKTTREFIAELEGIDGFADKYKGKTLEVLTICDLVKYSDYASNLAELSEGAVSAKDIIMGTRVANPESSKKD